MDNKLLKVVTDLYWIVDEMSSEVYPSKTFYRGCQCSKCSEYDGHHLATCVFSKLDRIGNVLRELDHKINGVTEDDY